VIYPKENPKKVESLQRVDGQTGYVVSFLGMNAFEKLPSSSGSD